MIAHSSLFELGGKKIKISAVFKGGQPPFYISISFLTRESDDPDKNIYNKFAFFNLKKDKITYRDNNFKVLTISKEDKLIIRNNFKILIDEVMIKDIII